MIRSTIYELRMNLSFRYANIHGGINTEYLTLGWLQQPLQGQRQVVAAFQIYILVPGHRSCHNQHFIGIIPARRSLENFATLDGPSLPTQVASDGNPMIRSLHVQKAARLKQQHVELRLIFPS